MRQPRRIAMVLGTILLLLVLSVLWGTRTSEPKSRQIAAGLMELHRQWETNSNIPSLFESLTNLPFHDHGGVVIGNGSVSRRYNALGIKWEQYYFIAQPSSTTNDSEWAVYRGWYWYWPGRGQKRVVLRKLLTLPPH